MGIMIVLPEPATVPTPRRPRPSTGSPWCRTWEPADVTAVTRHVVLSYLSPVHYNSVLPTQSPLPPTPPSNPSASSRQPTQQVFLSQPCGAGTPPPRSQGIVVLPEFHWMSGSGYFLSRTPTDHGAGVYQPAFSGQQPPVGVKNPTQGCRWRWTHGWPLPRAYFGGPEAVRHYWWFCRSQLRSHLPNWLLQIPSHPQTIKNPCCGTP